MNIIVPLLIIIGAAVIFYATRFLSTGFKILTKIALLAVMLMLVLTVIFFRDLGELKSDLATGRNTFVMVNGTKVVTAVTLQPGENRSYGIESFEYFSPGQIADLESMLKDQDYMVPGSKRIFLIEESILRRNYTLKLGADLDQDEMLEIIVAPSPYDLIAKKLVPAYNLSTSHLKVLLQDTYGSEDHIRGYLFAALLINYMQSEDADIIGSLKKGHLALRPEPRSFSILKSIPTP